MSTIVRQREFMGLIDTDEWGRLQSLSHDKIQRNKEGGHCQQVALTTSKEAGMELAWVVP
jgi:hypothetical protein